MSFKNRTVLITGASRGIGKAIGLKLASEGANIVIASKSVEENPRLGGTIYSAAAEMEAAGGRSLAVQCDIRFEDQVQQVVDKTVEKFGNILNGTFERRLAPKPCNTHYCYYFCAKHSHADTKRLLVLK